MEHNLTEQAIKDIQIVLSWLKDGSEMTPYNSIRRIIEQNALLRGIVDEKDKLLDNPRVCIVCEQRARILDLLANYTPPSTISTSFSATDTEVKK